MKIIPAIDIIDGQCVRLSQGDYKQKTVYNDDPIAVAQSLEDAGIKYLHLVDLDGAKAGKSVNLSVLEEIAYKTSLEVDFGGGIKSEDDVTRALDAGAYQINIGSMAALHPQAFLSILDTHGPEKIILGADCKDRKIAAVGWTNILELDIVSYIKSFVASGVIHVVCTDIGKDGMLAGPSWDLYNEIMRETDVKLVASGGITTIEDIHHLREMGCAGAIIGKAIYEGRIPIDKLGSLC